MSIYAISDLHLSGEPAKKPMDIFGEHWTNHKEKVKENWLATVKEEDTVIICGDISWAMQLKEVEEDLLWITELPGKKILMRGNHDYWWTSLKKMQDTFGKHFEFLQNNCIMIGDTAICGTRGWLLPSSENFTEDDNKIYQREGIRLEMSLQAAKANSAERIIVAFHYPPLFAPTEQTLFTDLLEKYQVKDCVYGHIHGENHLAVFEEERNGVQYKLVSCDTQGFKLYKIV